MTDQGIALDEQGIEMIDEGNVTSRTADYWLKETRYAARALLARPAFTLTAGATLALGIGLTTAMFSIVYGVLIKPLPYPEPDRIVRLWDSHEKVPFFSVTVSNFFDWREESKSFAAIGAYRETGLNLMVNGEPERRPGALVTAGLLPVLGVAPEHGRFFLEEEDQPGAEPVVNTDLRSLAQAFCRARGPSSARH